MPRSIEDILLPLKSLDKTVTRETREFILARQIARLEVENWAHRIDMSYWQPKCLELEAEVAVLKKKIEELEATR